MLLLDFNELSKKGFSNEVFFLYLLYVAIYVFYLLIVDSFIVSTYFWILYVDFVVDRSV